MNIVSASERLSIDVTQKLHAYTYSQVNQVDRDINSANLSCFPNTYTVFFKFSIFITHLVIVPEEISDSRGILNVDERMLHLFLHFDIINEKSSKIRFGVPPTPHPH